MIEKKNDFPLYLLRLGLDCDTVENSGMYIPTECEDVQGMWEDILNDGIRQGVIAVQLDGLTKLIEQKRLPDDLFPCKELKRKMFSHSITIETNHKKQIKALSALANFYSSHGIPMMVLKGYGLSILYPNPSHRPCGDIDIWLYGRQREADNLLRKEKNVTIDLDHHHHTVFHVNGVMFENHYDFLNVHGHISSREIENVLQEWVKEEGDSITVGNERIFLPPANFNALFLLRHSGSHFAAEAIGLRHLTDWAMFLKTYHDRIDWERLREQVVKQNIYKFMDSINGICIDYLGVPENIFPAFERDRKLEEKVFREILACELGQLSRHKGILSSSWFRMTRWWKNRWKHRLVYRENLFSSFFILLRSHWLDAADYAE